jgi:hypothetical protein
MKACLGLIISVLVFGGCRENLPPENPKSESLGAAVSETGAPSPKITRSQAVEKALKRLREEAFAGDIDAERMTVHYTEFGPKGESRIRWIIDFARRESPEITPGQWARGYWVVVDPDTGVVIEASAYKR